MVVTTTIAATTHRAHHIHHRRSWSPPSNIRQTKAMVLFEAGKYDLVITDYTMPGTNGVEFARQLRQRTPGQPIILITGSSYTIAENSAQPLPVNSILQKPFSVEEFHQAVTTLFMPARVPA